MHTSFRYTIAACTTVLLLFSGCSSEKEKSPRARHPAPRRHSADHWVRRFCGCLPPEICDLIGRDNCNLAVVARSKSSNKIVAKAYLSSRDTCWLKPNGCEAKGYFARSPLTATC